MRYDEFHLSWFGPLPHWPRGGWSLYQISGDQIAQRTIYTDGKVTQRHSWCGYIGIFETLPEAVAAIEALRAGKSAA